MANEYKNSIRLGVVLKPTSEIQNELNTAIKQLEKNSNIDLKIDTNSINQSLKDFSNTLNNISNKIKSDFNFEGVFSTQASGINNVTNRLKEEQQVIEKTANAMKTLSSTTIGKADSNGNITEVLKTVEQLQTGLGNTTKLTTDLKTGLSNASNTENFQKLNNIIDNLQNKLNKSSNNKFINESVISELQNKLNGINTNTAEKEIKQLQQTINNLSSSDSQIVRLQNTISKMENNLTNMKGKYGSLVGDSSSKAQLESYTSQVEKLKSVLSSLQNGGTISGQKLASELNLGTNASRELSTAVKNSANALKLATTDSESFGQSIKRALQNTGLYLGTYQAIQMLTNSFKDAITYVVQLDSAMTNLKKVTNETNETYSSFLNQAHDIAMEYGSQADKVVDATTSWAKTGESLKNATELAKSTMLLTKVGDVENVATAQQYMIAPLKAFQIEADKSITLIDKYNNISNNMATSTNDLGEALSKSASSMSTAGNTLEQTLALIATAESQTKLGGDVVGQAMKTTSLRIATFKDENGELIPKFEEQLKALGVTMRDTTTGQILPTFEILKQVGEKFKTMDTNSKLNISQLLGGKLQANVVSSILNNVDELNRAYNLAQNSSNSAMNEFKTYQQGVQYSIDQLKESISNMYKESMNSSTLKSFIDMLTKLISTFGNLPTVIGLATTAFLVFKGQAITSAISGLVSYVSTLVAVTKSTGALKLATAELDIALSTNPFGLIAIAITGAIVAMDLFNASVEKTKQSNDDYIQSLQNKNPNQGQELLDNYKETQSELSNLKQGTDEYKAKEEELASVQEQLISLYPQATSEIDKNTGKKKLNADTTQDLINKEKEYAQAKAIQVFKDNKVNNTKDVKEIAEGYTKATSEMKKYQDMYNNGERYFEADNGRTVDVAGAIEKNRKESEAYLAQLNALKGALGIVEDKSGSYVGALDIINNTLGISTNKTQEDTKTKQDNANKTKVLTQASKELQSANGSLSADTVKKIAEVYPEVGDNADKAKAKVNEFNKATEDAHTESVKKASEDYSNACSNVSELKELVNDLNKKQEVTPEIVQKITKNYHDLVPSLGSVSEAQEALNKKINEQEQIATEAYNNMLANDKDYYAKKYANDEDWQNNLTNILNQLNQVYGGYTQSNIDNMNNELKGAKSLAQQRAMIEADLISSLQKAWSDYYAKLAEAGASFQVGDTKVSSFYSDGRGGYIKPEDEAGAKAYEAQMQAQNELSKSLLKQSELAKKARDLFANTKVSIPTNFGGSVDGTGGGSGGSGGKGKSEADEAKKAEKDALNDLTTAYDKAKSIIEDDINAIDTQLQELGDTDSNNFVQKVDLTNQKLAKQQEEVKLASDQLEKLKGTTFSTAEGQDALESSILKANKELRTQTLEASKLQKELEKLEQEQLKKYYENQKEIETQKLEATQQAQNDKLDEIKQQQEEIHNAKMDYFDAELKALEEQNEAEDKANELQEKQIDLKQKEIDLERIKNQGIIQEYSKDATGNWGYSYTYDKDAYDKKQKEVDESKKSLEETKRKQKYEEEKKAIEDQKTAEEKLYKEKEDYLDKYSKQLKDQQDRDKKRIETYYSDIDSLTKTTLKTLEEQYSNNWTAIANSISTSVSKSKKEIEDLQTLSANFVASDVVKAINGGDVSGFLKNNQNKMNQQANVDENEIDNYFKTIDASANSANDTILKLSDSYKDLSVIKQENLNITDDDIKQNKKQVANITKIDFDGLSEQLKNLKEINAQIEKELDTHYNNELTRQNKAQSDEIDSFNKFAKEYLLKTNKLCELLQVVWDFRFSNIVTIVDNAGVIISQTLEAWSIAYEDFAKIWNSMNDEDHQIANKIEIKDALSTIENTHTTVVQWETDKSKLYDQKTFEEFAKNIQGNIQDSLLNKLNNYSGTVGTVSSTSNSSVVNNKNNTTTSNVTNLSINQLDVNTKDAQNLLNQLLTLVNNKTNLS